MSLESGLRIVIEAAADFISSRIAGPTCGFVCSAKESPIPQALFCRVAEYLSANVMAVVVIDPVPQRVHIYSADNETTILGASDKLTFPDVLPGLEVIVGKLFE